MRCSRALAGVGIPGAHTAASDRGGVLSRPFAPTSSGVPHRPCGYDIPNTLILGLPDNPVK
jgi:hypothetical protein